MEELFKTLNIKEINYLYIDYIDNHGNFKTIKLEHPSEMVEVKEIN